MLISFLINRKFRNLSFLLLWLLVSTIFEFHKSVFLPPLSIHQGAQADRASIALNYAQESMNFFEPRVMETGTRDGITPCEFPLMNYTAACLYKMFGYHPFWYRFTMWCLVGAGLWALTQLFSLWFNSYITALVLSYTWYFSGVLAFYTANFLPDAASMSFMMLGLRQWYLNEHCQSKSAILFMSVFFTIACLLKITSLVFVIAIFTLSIYKFVINKRPLGYLLPFLICIAGVILWYAYGKWLEKEVGGSYFLLSFTLPSSLNEFREWFHIFYANWFFQTYSLFQWLFCLLGVIAIFLLKRSDLKTFTLISLIGVLLFYFLMSMQFRFHDYYIICLLPLMAFLMGNAYEWLQTYLKKWAILPLILICFYSLVEAKNTYRLRYTPGNYLYQTFFEPGDFSGVENWLDSNGIHRRDKILASFDPNPNVLLYFLNRRGYRVNDHPENFVLEKLNLTGNLITTDTTLLFKNYPVLRNRISKVSEHHTLSLFRPR